MSYSRGILYVYEADTGFNCICSGISNGYFECNTRTEMINHLIRHIKNAFNSMYAGTNNKEICEKAWLACVRLYAERSEKGEAHYVLPEYKEEWETHFDHE